MLKFELYFAFASDIGSDGATERQGGRSWLSQLSFYWAGSIMAEGLLRPLSTSDLFGLKCHLEPAYCSRQLWSTWTEVGSHISCACIWAAC